MVGSQALPPHVLAARSYELESGAGNVSANGSKRALRWDIISKYSGVRDGIARARREAHVSRRHLHLLERRGLLRFDTSATQLASSSSSTYTSDALEVGKVYTRDDLRSMFGISDATLDTGIFQPKGHLSVWLFATEEKQSDREQYKDLLEDDVLLMQGQMGGIKDDLLKQHEDAGLELLVFYRKRKYEHSGAGFRYEGRFDYVRSFGSRPTSFVLLRESKREYKYGPKPAWRLVLRAVQELGGSASQVEISEYIADQIPHFNLANVRDELQLLSVNSYSRGSHDAVGDARRTDGGNPYDALFRVEGEVPIFELYEPSRHGIWALEPDATGKLRPTPNEASGRDIVETEQELEKSGGFDPRDDVDARERTLSSIVQRRGQARFRRQLLSAYGGCCAITRCPVIPILEAAHIKGYLGERTNHITNGILLRADMHTLFDLGLLRIHPESLTVELAAHVVIGYPGLANVRLALPNEQSSAPNRDALRLHYEAHKAKFAKR